MSQEGLPEPCEFELVRPSPPAPSTPTQPLSASAPDAPIRLGSRKRVHLPDESESDILAELMAESRHLVSVITKLEARSWANSTEKQAEQARHAALVDEHRRLAACVDGLVARIQVLENMVLPTPAATE